MLVCAYRSSARRPLRRLQTSRLRPTSGDRASARAGIGVGPRALSCAAGVNQPDSFSPPCAHTHCTGSSALATALHRVTAGDAVSRGVDHGEAGGGGTCRGHPLLPSMTPERERSAQGSAATAAKRITHTAPAALRPNTRTPPDTPGRERGPARLLAGPPAQRGGEDSQGSGADAPSMRVGHSAVRNSGELSAPDHRPDHRTLGELIDDRPGPTSSRWRSRRSVAGGHRPTGTRPSGPTGARHRLPRARRRVARSPPLTAVTRIQVCCRERPPVGSWSRG